jgi:hypothetical protein
MKIGHWKQAHAYLTRPDTKTPEQRASIEVKKSKAEVDRKNKKRAEYGLQPLAATDAKKDFNPQTLKPGTTLDDVTRNFLIEESKVRNLESEEIQYLMTDEQYRDKKPAAPATKPAAIKPKPVQLEFDFAPLPQTTIKPDPKLDEASVGIQKLVDESNAEKFKNQNSGLGYLAGGSKAYGENN